MSRKILGIRTSPNEVRFALLEKDADGTVSFLNRENESKLIYPANEDNIGENLVWLKIEIDRIFRQEPEIELLALKTSEYSGSDSKAKRKSSYAEAVCILSASEHHIPVCCKLYSQLGVSFGSVKQHAEERFGRTAKYWDSKIADAIIVANSAW